MSFASDMSDVFPLKLIPQTLMTAPLGVVSPLWGLFATAAAGGVAFWWMTRWMQPANLEAMMGATFVTAGKAAEKVETASDTVVAFVAAQPAVEPVMVGGGEAGPISALVEANIPVEAIVEAALAPVEAVVEAAFAPIATMVEAAAAPTEAVVMVAAKTADALIATVPDPIAEIVTAPAAEIVAEAVAEEPAVIEPPPAPVFATESAAVAAPAAAPKAAPAVKKKAAGPKISAPSEPRSMAPKPKPPAPKQV